MAAHSCCNAICFISCGFAATNKIVCFIGDGVERAPRRRIRLPRRCPHSLTLRRVACRSNPYDARVHDAVCVPALTAPGVACGRARYPRTTLVCLVVRISPSEPADRRRECRWCVAYRRGGQHVLAFGHQARSWAPPHELTAVSLSTPQRCAYSGGSR